MTMQKCFLCGKTNINGTVQLACIDNCSLPASQKPISFVLQHLANLIQTKLVFNTDACICAECLEELTNYDTLMLNLLVTQKKLTQQLQKTLSNITRLKHSDAQHWNEEFVKMAPITISFSPETLKEDKSEKDYEDDDTIPLDKNRKCQECVICGINFRSKYQLQNHIAESHNSQIIYTCNICGVTRRDEEYLELHMNTHEGKSENECRYCPKKFSRPVNTLRHMRVHWDKKKYQCEKCGERFSLDNMLYNHRLRHEAEENPLICNICNQSFKSRKTFNHHVLIHQKNRPRHYCNKCPKSFTERYTLKVHMKSHENALGNLEPLVHHNEEQLTSEPNLDNVSVIVEEVHTSNMFMSCVICNMNFENKEILERHLQSVHDVILGA